MPTTRSLSTSLLLLALVPACGPAADEASSPLVPFLRATRSVDLAPDDVSIARAPSRAAAPGAWAPPAPAAPSDCRETSVLVAADGGAIRVLSFAGTFDTWAATYTSTSSSAESTTYLVTMDAGGRPTSPPRRVADETRVVSYGYALLLVDPALEALAMIDGSGHEQPWGVEHVTWTEPLAADARVLEVYGTPNRCSYEAAVLVGSSEGRTLLTLRGTSEVTIERALAPSSASALGVAPTDLLELTPAVDGVSTRALRYTLDGWAVASEGEVAAIEPLGATRTWSGWSVVGTRDASLEVFTLADDGSASTPVVVPDTRCSTASLASSGDVTLLATTSRAIAIDHGVVSLDEGLGFVGERTAATALGGLAAIGGGGGGVSMRCYGADALHAPAP